ncbi:hypothetical protein WICMUC_004450 [Wickerhamomyces mucosus]|uniref:Uncharacterized protein n=1 Tax=Wickerhamomyces mucosus TaxID=1378264 RepID=A0A9P8TAX5_9ASCO|nr:hypothetical protein WICMUC_004450 [Wickerhamomyces mucosus]
MITTDSYSPQSESLTHLQYQLTELQTILSETDGNKRHLVDKIDELIKSFKGSEVSDEIQDTLNHIQDFINSQLNRAKEVNREPLSSLEKLKLQNAELKRLYESKLAYYKEISDINGEYESSIEKLLSRLKDIKHTQNLQNLNSIRAKSHKLNQLKISEFEIFDQLSQVENVNCKLVRIITNLIKILNSGNDSDEEIKLNQLIYQLKFYSNLVEGKNPYYDPDFDHIFES